MKKLIKFSINIPRDSYAINVSDIKSTLNEYRDNPQVYIHLKLPLTKFELNDFHNVFSSQYIINFSSIQDESMLLIFTDRSKNIPSYLPDLSFEDLVQIVEKSNLLN